MQCSACKGVGARLIAAATLAQLHQEGQEASGYLKSALEWQDAGFQ